MFAPDVPRDDIRLVIDATLADGTHLDLLEEKPPDFEIQKRGPYYMSQHWCEIHARLRRLPEHWRNFRDFLYRIPAKRGWGPEKQVVAVEVWQVMGMVPKPGSTEWGEITRQKLFDQNL
jgi:hypothetical protein